MKQSTLKLAFILSTSMLIAGSSMASFTNESDPTKLSFSQQVETTPNFITNSDINFTYSYLYSMSGNPYQVGKFDFATSHNTFGLDWLDLNFSMLAGEQINSKVKTGGLSLSWRSAGTVVVEIGAAVLFIDKDKPDASLWWGFGYKF